MLLIHSYPLRYVAIDTPLAHFFSVAGFTHGKYINIACDLYFDGASCRLPAITPTMLPFTPQMHRAVSAVSAFIVIASTTHILGAPCFVTIAIQRRVTILTSFSTSE